MKKLVFTLLLVSLVAAGIGIGTWAYFSDYEHSLDNCFTAGSLDLKVDGEDDPNVGTYFEIECIKPGDGGVAQINLANVGCVDGVADIHLMKDVDDENVIVEPEAELGDTEPDGELCEYLDIMITADLDGDATYETLVAEGNLSDLDCTNFIIGDLDAESDIDILIEWEVDETVGNIIQTDICCFDIEFSLNQKIGECDIYVGNFTQAETGVVCEPYTITAEVHNAGTITCSAWVTVNVYDEATNVVATFQEFVQNLAPCDKVYIDFVFHPEAAGVYAAASGEVYCPFVVLEPSNLVATNVAQDPDIQRCEDLTVVVTVSNTGGVDGSGTVMVGIADPATETSVRDPQFIPTGNVPAGGSVDLPVNWGHVDDTYPDMIVNFAAVGPPPEAVCMMSVLDPFICDIVAIDQPVVMQPCETAVITVRVANLGDKPGECTVDLTIDGDSMSAPTGIIDPGTSVDVPFSWHANETDIPGVTVTAVCCDGADTETCDIIVAGPGQLTVVNIQQPEVAYVCDPITISVDVQNIGGKPAECIKEWEIIGPMGPIDMGSAPVPLLQPGEVHKQVIFDGHVDESWLPGPVTVIAWACDMAVVECVIEIQPPPGPPIQPASTEFQYYVDYFCDHPAYGGNETDMPFDVHVLATDTLPPTGQVCGETLDCNPGEPIPSSHWTIETYNAGPPGFTWSPPCRMVVLLGVETRMQIGLTSGGHTYDMQFWYDESNAERTYEETMAYGPYFATDAYFKYWYGNYTGVQPGFAYDPIPSETWNFAFALSGCAVAFGSCFTPTVWDVECHVVGEENIVVPAYPGGHDTIHIQCVYTPREVGVRNGQVDIWWSPTLGIFVRQINDNIPYVGLETWELSIAPS